MKSIRSTKAGDLKYLAIQLLFLTTFGLAALAKWFPPGIPDGFINQFSETWMAGLPGSLFIPYYTIAITEAFVSILFLISIFKMEWLQASNKNYMKYGLIMSLFIFVILAYGLRLVSEFQGTANAFFYFGTTLLALYVVEQEVQTVKPG